MCDYNILKYKFLTIHAKPLTKKTECAAGFDLHSAYEYVVQPGGKEQVKTDIVIALPNGTYGRIAPVSGLAWRHFINVGAYVIDKNYCGRIVILFNLGSGEFIIKPGDKIAQLICERYASPALYRVDNLDEMVRNARGVEAANRYFCESLDSDIVVANEVGSDTDGNDTVYSKTIDLRASF